MFWDIVKDLDLPNFVKIKQNFDKTSIRDVAASVREALAASSLPKKIKPGDSVAVGVGSRGVANIDKAARATVDFVKQLGGKPCIVPAMGSHGGATAEGQRGILSDFGITEETMGAPITASMDTVHVGDMADGTPIYFDRHASEADAIIPINRVKVHTELTGEQGSGLLKLIVIGFGKHKGAMTIHRRGLSVLQNSLSEASGIIMDRMPIATGLALVENAYGQTALVQALEPETMLVEEKKLLVRSKELMASLPARQIDLLLVDQIGKNISGSGMDSNIIGRMGVWGQKEFDFPRITKIVVLHLTEQTHGNAVGIGLADFTTRDLVNRIDYRQLYTNLVTATYVQRGFIPVTLDTEEEAVRVGFDTCWASSPSAARACVIKNTNELELMYASEALMPELLQSGRIEIVSTGHSLRFDANRRWIPFSY